MKELELILEEDAPSDDDTINEDVAEALATETRTTDPVRLASKFFTASA